MKKRFTILMLLTLFFNLSKAQDGTLDTTFGTNGIISGYAINVRDMEFDFSINKIVLAGSNSSNQPIIMRLNLDGSLDNSFDSDGIKILNFGATTDYLNSLYIISGNYYVSSYSKGAFAIVNATTSVSTEIFYNSMTYTTGYHDVIITSDYSDKPIIITDNHGFTEDYSIRIYRYNTNNTLDTTFNGTGYVNNIFYGIGNLAGAECDENGNIYVSKTTSDGTYYSIYTKKFNASGVQDNTYTLDGNNSNNKSLTKPNILFDFNGESFSYGMNYQNKFLIAKRNSSGIADTSFGSGGFSAIDFTSTYYDNAKSITGHEDGASFKMILIGRTRAQAATAFSNISLTRTDANGNLDTTFGTNGYTSVATPNTTYTENVFNAFDYDNGKLYVMASGILYRFNVNSYLSTNEITKNNQKIIVYPNPTKNFITIQNKENLTENFDYKIIDLTGRIVKKGNSKFNEQINIESLENGNYIIQIETENGGKQTEKLIKN